MCVCVCYKRKFIYAFKSVNPTVKRVRQRQVRKIMITPVQPCNFLGFLVYRLAVITAISLGPQ